MFIKKNYYFSIFYYYFDYYIKFQSDKSNVDDKLLYNHILHLIFFFEKKKK